MSAALSAETIDLSRLPPPDIIEALGYETLNAAFLDRFETAWAAAQAIDPTLPDWDVRALETDPAVILSEVWAFLRLLDRQRVNDAARAVLATLAKKADLDVVVARVNVQRLVVIEATDTTEAVMESDERLLMRYLLAFSRPAAGSREGYLYDVYTALPILHHAAVVGRAVHGRRGETSTSCSPDPMGAISLMKSWERAATRCWRQIASQKRSPSSPCVRSASFTTFRVASSWRVGLTRKRSATRAKPA